MSKRKSNPSTSGKAWSSVDREIIRTIGHAYYTATGFRKIHIEPTPKKSGHEESTDDVCTWSSELDEIKRKVIKTLPDQQQMILYLRRKFFETGSGLSWRETLNISIEKLNNLAADNISRELGISVADVKKVIFDAKRKVEKEQALFLASRDLSVEKIASELDIRARRVGELLSDFRKKMDGKNLATCMQESPPATIAVKQLHATSVSRPIPNSKKWEWKDGLLTNRKTGQSFDATQAWRDDKFQCFEFASGLPHKRVMFSVVDFRRPSKMRNPHELRDASNKYECVSCAAPLPSKKSGFQRCSKCGQMHNLG